ncbi:LOW QUALITY PROTEIN: hypothetical protein BT93_J0035 [Corymbia citriodora subsp. variegata]|nr:LOW QUALITY PROTEIN: hypothetical protein BT93_J0035 [Corymbia citriodora subsp. variegata]
MAAGKVSLKLLVDKSSRTVLFAEAGIDFVDFLIDMLLLPIGMVIQLLEQTRMVGSLGNLYGSMNDVYIESSKKDILLNPKAPAFLSQMPFLLPEISSSAPVSAVKRGFVQGVVTYMVMDDLEVKPMSTISSITLLKEFNVKEIGNLEERVGIMLLRASLHSEKVLTEVFLGEKK